MEPTPTEPQGDPEILDEVFPSNREVGEQELRNQVPSGGGQTEYDEQSWEKKTRQLFGNSFGREYIRRLVRGQQPPRPVADIQEDKRRKSKQARRLP